MRSEPRPKSSEQVDQEVRASCGGGDLPFRRGTVESQLCRLTWFRNVRCGLNGYGKYHCLLEHPFARGRKINGRNNCRSVSEMLGPNTNTGQRDGPDGSMREVPGNNQHTSSRARAAALVKLGFLLYWLQHFAATHGPAAFGISCGILAIPIVSLLKPAIGYGGMYYVLIGAVLFSVLTGMFSLQSTS